MAKTLKTAYTYPTPIIMSAPVESAESAESAKEGYFLCML
ncbi:hypothetical protein C8R11_105114 [Nitrosomonas aestuarii]|nr:hypothetical protein C8R11_105114 [Nitrosomonas aestuarii]